MGFLMILLHNFLPSAQNHYKVLLRRLMATQPFSEGRDSATYRHHPERVPVALTTGRRADTSPSITAHGTGKVGPETSINFIPFLDVNIRK